MIQRIIGEHIEVITRLSADLYPVQFDESKIEQIILNLAVNAKDAMPEGGTLTVQTVSDGENVRVEISDTGTGIRKENLSKIFDTFFTTKDSVKDVGLGLSVCYGFIKDHGGDIKVESEWGSGTTFKIILPVSVEEIQ